MTEDGPAESDTPLQPTKKPKVCEPSVPAVAPEAATSLPSALPPVADSDEEHNLNTVAGCTDFITCLFSKERRSRVKPVAEFFVREKLVPQTKKICPLYKVFSAEMSKLGGLSTTQARTKWLQAWESNRGLKHLPLPQSQRTEAAFRKTPSDAGVKQLASGKL